MKDLPDDILITAYYQAIKLRLSSDFIKILRDEMEQRQLTSYTQKGNKFL